MDITYQKQTERGTDTEFLHETVLLKGMKKLQWWLVTNYIHQ